MRYVDSGSDVSGEEQMGILMKEYMNYLPLALIGVAFLKILLTNLGIQSGLKEDISSQSFLQEYAWDMVLQCCSAEMSRVIWCLRQQCYGSITRWNDEKTIGSYDASVFVLSGSNGSSGYSWRQPRAVREYPFRREKE